MKVFILTVNHECWVNIIGVYFTYSHAKRVKDSIPKYGSNNDNYFILEKDVMNEENSTQWIKIEDRLPPNNVYVLVSKLDDRKGDFFVSIEIASRINEAWIDDHNGEILNPKYGRVTHWMPLPDKPMQP